jgi:hypothetical protein
MRARNFDGLFSIATVTLIAVFCILVCFLLFFGSHNPKSPSEVLLSFDVEPVDGNDAVTSILDELRLREITATFFVTGEYALSYPAVVKRMAKEGHEIECHSFSHPNFRKLDYQEKQIELSKCKAALENVTGIIPIGFRAPYNRVDEDTYLALYEAGFEYDASAIENIGLFFPDAEDALIYEVPISSKALLPFEEVVWTYYLGLSCDAYVSVVKSYGAGFASKEAKILSIDFHPHNFMKCKNAFLGLLDEFVYKDTTFIKHNSFILSHNEEE